MAVGRLPTVLPPAQPTEVRQTPDVRQAQRAFFQAALGQAGVAAPAAPPAVARNAAPAPRQAPAEAAPESGRGYRPGSLLDVRI